jgi:hypothetical protein
MRCMYYRQLEADHFYVDFPELLRVKQEKRRKDNIVVSGATKMNKALASKMHDRVLALTSHYFRW